jgi:transcriptional regulator with XRE-family HTH domain
MLKPEFAAFIGISGSQYRYLRTLEANPTIEALCRMASALDISVYQLLEGKELGDRRNLDRWGMSKAFGEVFKAKMDASGLEREEFIKVANISMPQYYLVVRGLVNPTILTAVEIAKRLELTVWQLLGVEPWDGLPKAAVKTTMTCWDSCALHRKGLSGIERGGLDERSADFCRSPCDSSWTGGPVQGGNNRAGSNV